MEGGTQLHEQAGKVSRTGLHLPDSDALSLGRMREASSCLPRSQTVAAESLEWQTKSRIVEFNPRNNPVSFKTSAASESASAEMYIAESQDPSLEGEEQSQVHHAHMLDFESSRAHNFDLDEGKSSPAVASAAHDHIPAAQKAPRHFAYLQLASEMTAQPERIPETPPSHASTPREDNPRDTNLALNSDSKADHERLSAELRAALQFQRGSIGLTGKLAQHVVSFLPLERPARIAAKKSKSTLAGSKRNTDLREPENAHNASKSDSDTEETSSDSEPASEPAHESEQPDSEVTGSESDSKSCDISYSTKTHFQKSRQNDADSESNLEPVKESLKTVIPVFKSAALLSILTKDDSEARRITAAEANRIASKSKTSMRPKKAKSAKKQSTGKKKGPVTRKALHKWVQCNECQTWRKVPPRTAVTKLPDFWTCSMDPVNKKCRTKSASTSEKSRGRGHPASISNITAGKAVTRVTAFTGRRGRSNQAKEKGAGKQTPKTKKQRLKSADSEDSIAETLREYEHFRRSPRLHGIKSSSVPNSAGI